jgi:hypothetical protein
MGFEVNRFQGEVDEELVCPICSGVLEDPLQVRKSKRIKSQCSEHIQVSVGSVPCFFALWPYCKLYALPHITPPPQAFHYDRLFLMFIGMNPWKFII